MKVIAVVAMAATAIGCAPAARATTGDEMCKAMHWPMPLPATVGWSLMQLTNDSILSCLNNVTAIAPDGHDATNDPVNDASSWRITSMTPPAGTLVPMDQKINLTVVRDDDLDAIEEWLNG